VQGSSEVREILVGEAKAKYEARSSEEAHENKKAHESEDIRR
jgi:hypothetical protein